MNVAFFTLVPTPLGWALLAALERFTVKARPIWTGVAVVVLLTSLVMPFAAREMDIAARGVLLVVHLLVGGVVIPIFARTARRER